MHVAAEPGQVVLRLELTLDLTQLGLELRDGVVGRCRRWGCGPLGTGGLGFGESAVLERLEASDLRLGPLDLDVALGKVEVRR